jgi:hypothetical protein
MLRTFRFLPIRRFSQGPNNLLERITKLEKEAQEFKDFIRGENVHKAIWAGVLAGGAVAIWGAIFLFTKST